MKNKIAEIEREKNMANANNNRGTYDSDNDLPPIRGDVNSIARQRNALFGRNNRKRKASTSHDHDQRKLHKRGWIVLSDKNHDRVPTAE